MVPKLLAVLMCMGLCGCPDPPPEIAGDLDEAGALGAGTGDDPGGRSGDPDRMDLSPGGTLLLDISQVIPQQSQEELAASKDPTVTISGELKGTCDGGTVRIDVIEIGVEHTPEGPIIGPLTALSPKAPGPYSLKVPAGRNIQVAALCDVDNDQKIVQGTDKLAPGVAIGVISEDKEGVDLAYAGEGGRETPIPGSSDAPGDAPPGDVAASIPSAQDGEETLEQAPPVDDTEE